MNTNILSGLVSCFGRYLLAPIRAHSCSFVAKILMKYESVGQSRFTTSTPVLTLSNEVTRSRYVPVPLATHLIPAKNFL